MLQTASRRAGRRLEEGTIPIDQGEIITAEPLLTFAQISAKCLAYGRGKPWQFPRSRPEDKLEKNCGRVRGGSVGHDVVYLNSSVWVTHLSDAADGLKGDRTW